MDEDTPLLMIAVQAVMTEIHTSMKRAIIDPQDEDDRRLLEEWTSIQTMMGERFGRERDAGHITEEQYTYALDWLIEWMDTEPQESWALLDGWFDWVGWSHPQYPTNRVEEG